MSTPVQSCVHVVESHAPICLASHEATGWQMTCGGTHRAEDARETTLEALVTDPEVAWVVETLPEEWEAQRTAPGAPWVRRPLDDSFIVELP